MNQYSAYKFRIYPTAEQEIFFIKSFGCARFIYNKMLDDKIEHYGKTKESLQTTPAQWKAEFPRFKKKGVAKDKTGAYYASILFSFEKEITSIDPESIDDSKVIGLDYMMNGLFMSDIGQKGDYRRFYRANEKKLAKAQRKMSKMAKGSNNRNKAKQEVAKVHKKIANQRKDFLHKMSREIANSYDVVCVESLNMKGLSQALNFGKSVHDNGWGMFTTYLQYNYLLGLYWDL